MSLISQGLSALLMTATIFGLGCATSPAGRPRSIPAEIIEWRETDSIGVNRVFLVKVAYRDASGAVCTTTVEMDQLTWSRVRDGSPCIVPYGHRYTVSACP